MKSLFIKNFNLESANLMSVSGIGDQTALIYLLGKELVNNGARALVISTNVQRYPIEGKVLISDETDLLSHLISADEPEITYLARRVKGDLLEPFSLLAVTTLIKQLSENMRLIIHHDLSKNLPKGYQKIFNKAHRICTVNFNTLRDRVLDIYQNTAIRSSALAQKKVQQEFLNLIRENCPGYASQTVLDANILFIDQVKNVLDENLLIPVARSLANFKVEKILYGHVHHYQVKAI